MGFCSAVPRQRTKPFAACFEPPMPYIPAAKHKQVDSYISYQHYRVALANPWSRLNDRLPC
jgi:hypothetical protein